MTRSRPTSSGPIQPRPSRGADARRAQKPRSTTLQTALLWFVVSVAALVVAATTFLIIATPTDLIEDRIAQEVHQRTGRNLVVAGGSSLSILDGLGIKLHDVSLASPPDMGGGPMARVAEVDVKIPFWPLIRGELRVDRLVLRQPELSLRVDSDGRRNWKFNRPVRKAGPQRTGAGGGTVGSALAGTRTPLPLANVLIEDGIIRYANEKSDVREEISGLDLQVSASSLDSRLEATGDLTIRDQEFEFRGSLSSLSSLLEGAPSEFAIDLKGQPLKAKYEGTILTSPATQTAGTVAVQSSSIRALADWLDSSAFDEHKDEPLVVSGRLELTPAAVTLSEADVRLGDTTVDGLAILESRSGTRPRLSADLHVSQLDLGYWLTPTGKAASSRVDGGGNSGIGDESEPQSIDDLLRGTQTDGTQVRGFIARHGWSDVPFDYEKLGAIDADLKLLVDQVTYRKVKAGTARITARLADRRLDASINEMELYDGTGRGTVQLDATGSVPTIQAELQIDNVSAFDLLRDAAEFDWVDGKGRISIAITGQGQTEREVVETLNGKAEFAFRNGALVGVDIPGIIESLQRGRIPRLERNMAERTKFSALDATFSIENGTAQNRDLRLESELIHVSGAGKANLPDRTLDYTVRPKLLSGRKANGGESSSGLELPIRITGSWDHPTYAAEIDSVLKNPDDVVEAFKEIGKQLKGKNLSEALDSLLGGNDGDDGRKKPKARDLLRQFLKP